MQSPRSPAGGHLLIATAVGLGDGLIADHEEHGPGAEVQTEGQKGRAICTAATPIRPAIGSASFASTLPVIHIAIEERQRALHRQRPGLAPEDMVLIRIGVVLAWHAGRLHGLP